MVTELSWALSYEVWLAKCTLINNITLYSDLIIYIKNIIIIQHYK
jgi:hypothetical protein